MISYGFWKRELAGNRDVIGRTVAVGPHVLTIVGEPFQLLTPVDREIGGTWKTRRI